MSEVYQVTWRVPENEANTFVQKRKSKKDDFAKSETHKPERIQQKVESHGGAEGGELGKNMGRGFEDIGGGTQDSERPEKKIVS